ncbi:MAG: glycoside hydrolase family 2 TIM barrel-domain containing protein [Deltaproteobacteria bacterium]|nr:glycoside hydrolase family 2 TIM barrel-domain containing protein [Deltaproteobacteria bacterium]
MHRRLFVMPVFVALISCAPSVEGTPPTEPNTNGGQGGQNVATGQGGQTQTVGGQAGAASGGSGGSTQGGGAAGSGGVAMPNTGGAAGSVSVTGPKDTRAVVRASVSGYVLQVERKGADGKTATAPFDMRGICWSPAVKGGGQPNDAAFAEWTDKDFALMEGANINTVKSYGVLSRQVLDKMLAHGIVAVVTVLVRAGDNYAAAVNAIKDHPAVLMWLVGNEWNYNNLYGSCNGDGCYDVINNAAKEIKRLDPNHPVATSFAPRGEIPTADDLKRLNAIDVWGLNIYSQPGFFGRFSAWKALGEETGIKKPFFMSEYGLDAFDEKQGRENQPGHAQGLRVQTAEIRAQLSARNTNLPCIGGTPFEWSDEWWKSGAPGSQDRGGFPNIGVAMDQFANEEWWGVVDIDRKPRTAYGVLRDLYGR